MLFGLLVTLCIAHAHVAGLRTFTLEDLVPMRVEFYPERINVQWISETEYVLRKPGGNILKYNALTDTAKLLLNGTDLEQLGEGFSVMSFSSDGKFILLATNIRAVYRHSKLAEYWIYDLETKMNLKLGSGPLQAVIWSEGKALAYVEKNNVYYVPDVTRPQQDNIALTTQGEPEQVYYGVTDWIYEEEVFSAAEAMWFSPKGTYLAVASFNDTNVESASFPYYGTPSAITNQYPEMIEFKYPKAGRTNPDVGLHVYKLKGTSGDPWSIPAPVDLVGLDFILGRVNWATEKNLIVLWLNRRQNISVLVNCDLENDKCSIVKERSEPTGWIDINEPFFDKSGTQMIELQPMENEEKRYMHVGRLDFNTFEVNDLSPGNATVTEILGWNQETDTVYYVVSPCEAPWQRQVWSSSGGKQRCVSCRETYCIQCSFAPGGLYGVVTCSATNDPPRYYLFDTQNETFKLLVDNKKLKRSLSQFQLPLPLFNVVPLQEDVTSHIKLMLPPDMQPGLKYPMVVRVYAGPGTSRVLDSYELDYGTYMSANRSFIVAAVDVRGSEAQGVEALHAVNNALGTVEITDTLDSIRRLVELYPFIDASRIGVWGWSYGGYATTMMLLQDHQKLLSCGAAVAPVTSWLYYDSIYTERFMDTPENNEVGYSRSDLMQQAERMRGRRYLLVHGSGDDNVHYQHSMLLAKTLQHKDIAFEQMSYTDESHSLFGVSRHFYHTLDHFWTECFA